MTRIELHRRVTDLGERLAVVEAAMPQVRLEVRQMVEQMQAVTNALEALVQEMRDEDN